MYDFFTYLTRNPAGSPLLETKSFSHRTPSFVTKSNNIWLGVLFRALMQSYTFHPRFDTFLFYPFLEDIFFFTVCLSLSCSHFVTLCSSDTAEDSDILVARSPPFCLLKNSKKTFQMSICPSILILPADSILQSCLLSCPQLWRRRSHTLPQGALNPSSNLLLQGFHITQ